MHAAPDTVPRPALLALGALVAGALLLAGTARWTGIGSLQVEDAPVVSERALRFEDREDGGIDVLDADARRVVSTVAPGTNGFLRSTVRGLVRERKREGFGAQTPFRLRVRADGRLTLEDPTTNRRIDLEAFGATNAAAFARLLPPRQP